MRSVDGGRLSAWLNSDIVGKVAAMTEGDPGVESEKSPTTSLVNRDSGTRWASRLAVQFDVGELGVLQWSCVRNREAIFLRLF